MLIISSDALAQIDTACTRGAHDKCKHEICGFLAGHMTGTEYYVQFGLPVPNSAEFDQEHRYEITSGAFNHADRLVQSQGLQIVGVFHSHPNGRAQPSRLDMDYFFPGWIYLIIGVSAGTVNERRAFCLSDIHSRTITQADMRITRGTMA